MGANDIYVYSRKYRLLFKDTDCVVAVEDLQEREEIIR